MMKRLIVIFLSIFIINFLQISTSIFPFVNQNAINNQANAAEILKINSVSFDDSDTIIFLGTSGLRPDEPLSVNKVKLKDPDRIYFDINNAVLTRPNATFEFKNSTLEQLRIAQNSTNPNVVRIVINYKNTLDPNEIKVLKHNNNIIIKLKNTTTAQPYLTQIYRETKTGYNDVYETSTVTEGDPPAPVPQASQPDNDLFNQIHQAFKDTTNQLSQNVESAGKTAEPVRINPPIKEPKLRSRYFIDKMILKQNNILISGVGLANLEKPMYLTDPSRVVFDFANTVVTQNLRNKEIKINEQETIRIGQFEPSKARVVIITPNPDKYRAIYAPDLQNILIANDSRMEGVKLAANSAAITFVTSRQIDKTSDALTIDFSAPIVHSIKKDNANSRLEIYLYNVKCSSENYSEQVRNTPLYASRLDYMKDQGVKITIPVGRETTAYGYESLDATRLHMVFKNPEPPKKPVKITPPKTQSVKGKIVILDPGHGGIDTGAFKAGIAEKDLNLDISKKLAAILTNKGLHVEMTRWDDSTKSLEERVEFSNAKKTALFVSVHINSSVKPEVYGIETHYYTEAGFEVAQVIHKSLINKIVSEDRGLFKSKFYVINHTQAPAVLLELGFLSNDNERNSLLTEERKQKSAEAIADGIIDYLKTQPNR